MVCVISATGERLMPTNYKRARKLMKKARAEIVGHNPFTIRILDRKSGAVQPVEYCCDTGDQHIGVSIRSEKQEFVSAQYDLLKDEPERHRKRRMHRRNRRSGKRYRAPRFNNRKGMIAKEGFAPTIRNKRDQHVLLFERYRKVMPITSAVFEMGSFDTQVLQALEQGLPVPQGLDYQHGPRYGLNTLRDAVFARDHHTCLICGRNSFKDHVILRMHHFGFWKGDHGDRMGNVGTVCTGCHTAKNHKKGGKLFGLTPKIKKMSGATFMNTVRWDLLKRLKAATPNVEFHITYGSSTKEARHNLQISKSHANDAYAMGSFHPKKRAKTLKWQKKRRNNRILEKFYDAKYVDLRDKKVKSGKELSSDRTNRSQPRNGFASPRKLRGRKVKAGRRSIRRTRYPLRPGDRVIIAGVKHTVKGTHNLGKSIVLENGRSVAVSKVNSCLHCGGYVLIQ